MKVLLSPAKTLNFNLATEFPEPSISIFSKEAEILVKKLKKKSVKNIAEMMHLSVELAELNYFRFQNWENPNQILESNRPCIYAFAGEVYKGFDAVSLTADQITVAQSKIRILSGLYGLLKPLDLIYPYRLEMGTKWDISPKVKNLYSFWGAKIINSLNHEMIEKGENEIINLASVEYFKSIDLKKCKHKIITPIFKEFKNGQSKIVMMHAKHARGAMARYIVVNNINSADQLKHYNIDGYQLDTHQSNENEFVFIR